MLTLRSKLAVGLAVVAAVPLVIFQQVASRFVRAEFALRTADQLSVMTRLIEEHFGQEVDRVASNLVEARGADKAIAALDRYNAEGRLAQGELIQVIGELASTHGLPLLTLYDDQGTVIACAQEPSRFDVVDIKTIEHARAQQGRPIFDQEEGIEIRGLVLRVSTPIDEFGRRFWMSGGVRIDSEFLRSLPVVEAIAFVVLDEHGALTSQTSAGRSAAEVLGKLSDPWVGRQVLEAAGWDVTEIVVPGIATAERVELLVASSRLPLASFLSWLQRTSLLLLGGGVLLAWALAYGLSRLWTAPIDRLVVAVERVAQGDLKARVGLTTSDEWGRLGRSFDSMTAELADSRDRLLEAERVAAWREIARRLAHEIKNPLSPIALSMETLRRSHAAGRPDFAVYLEECTSTVLEEVERLRRIVEEFSTFGRLPAPCPVEESMHEIIRGVVLLYAGGLDYKFVTELEAGSAQFEFDPDQINRLLVNLVKNAVEAMPGGGEIRIATKTDSDAGRFRLWLQDTGAGVSHELAGLLFRPCESHKPGGAGLGLAIVHRIASEHGGSIKLTNPGEPGACFLLELPLRHDPREAQLPAALEDAQARRQ